MRLDPLVNALRRLVVVLALIPMLSAPVLAGGFETKGLGSRALAMGGAAIGLADDWSAIYWNPAGLAFLKGSAVHFELQSLWSQQRTSMSVRNISVFSDLDYLAGDFVKFGATRDVEPDRYTNKTLGAFIPTPDLGWYANFGDYTLATGLYATSGGGVAWKDRLTGFNEASPADSIDGNIQLGFFTLNVPLAFAMKFFDRISVGVNVAGVIGYNTREVTKTYQYADATRAPLKFENSSESLSFGVGLDVGVKAKVTREFSLGAVLRMPYTVTGSGESRFEIPEESCAGGDCQWTQYVEEGNSQVETEQPLRWGVGLAYLPNHRLKFDVDLYWVGHSQFITRSAYGAPDGSLRYLADSSPEWGFIDTFMVRTGAEYEMTKRSAVRTGFIYDPSPFKAERAALTSPRFTDGYIWTAGYGHRFDSWNVDFAYQFAYSPERRGTVETMGPNGEMTPEELAVTGQGHVATVTLGYLY